MQTYCYKPTIKPTINTYSRERESERERERESSREVAGPPPLSRLDLGPELRHRRQ